MSEHELNRVEVTSQVAAGTLSVKAAANMLAMSIRQMYRVLKRFEEEGSAALSHRLRGKPSNNKYSAAKRDYALQLVKDNYHDFGPTLAAEKLSKEHGVKVSKETLRKWMVGDGIWLNKSQRRTFHRPRLRRECRGELVQIDGSEHRWFEDRGPMCTLLVFIDDATSTLMELRFVPSESTFSYFVALESYLKNHGRPVAFYSDRHSIFRVNNKEAKSGHGMTQFGRALSELNIEIICANSSQAKGRVERANRTLQDRLVKELRLAKINDMDAANELMPAFIKEFNAQFAKHPARPDNLHRACNVEPERMREILCWRDERYVSNQLTFSYDSKRILLDENQFSRSSVGKYVDTYLFPNGSFEVRKDGFKLPFKIFDKDQRVSQGEIVDNKRLGAVLQYIKEQQEADDELKAKAKKVGKQRSRYKKKQDNKDVIEQSLGISQNGLSGP